jgi:hypothetical protein
LTRIMRAMVMPRRMSMERTRVEGAEYKAGGDGAAGEVIVLCIES